MAAIGGRWHVGTGIVDFAKDLRYVYAAQPDGELFIVAKVWANEDGNFADTARLVAAAPELLAALNQAYDALDWAECEWESADGANRMHDCRVAIGRVIAKAEGRGE